MLLRHSLQRGCLEGRVGETLRGEPPDDPRVGRQPSGSRSWVQRIAIRGRRRELGLGGFPLVSLKEARALAFANRKLARAGGDPLAEKRRLQRTPTFAAAVEQPGGRTASCRIERPMGRPSTRS